MAKIDENVKVMMLKGEPGSSIKSIDKTSTSGLTDTYTITLTDGGKQHFAVTNGKQGEGLQSLEIGGRNFVRNRAGSGELTQNGLTLACNDNEFRVYGTCNSSVTAFGLGNLLESSNLFEPGGTYTLTTYPQLPAGIYLGVNTKTSSAHTVTTLNKNETGKSKTFTIPDDSTGYCCVFVCCAPANLPDGGKVDVTFKMKLEHGNKASDWTPAPEDKADAKIQEQIVPSASVESSATASQAYIPGTFVVFDGVLFKVTVAIAKGDPFSPKNLAFATVAGELESLASKFCETDTWHALYETEKWSVYYTKRYEVLYLRVHVGGLGSDFWRAGDVLPAEYRPKMDFYAPMYNHSENACAGVYVGKNGQVTMHSYQTSTSTSSWAIVSIPLW